MWPAGGAGRVGSQRPRPCSPHNWSPPLARTTHQVATKLLLRRRFRFPRSSRGPSHPRPISSMQAWSTVLVGRCSSTKRSSTAASASSPSCSRATDPAPWRPRSSRTPGCRVTPLRRSGLLIRSRSCGAQAPVLGNPGCSLPIECPTQWRISSSSPTVKSSTPCLTSSRSQFGWFNPPALTASGSTDRPPNVTRWWSARWRMPRSRYSLATVRLCPGDSRRTCQTPSARPLRSVDMPVILGAARCLAGPGDGRALGRMADAPAGVDAYDPAITEASEILRGCGLVLLAASVFLGLCRLATRRSPLADQRWRDVLRGTSPQRASMVIWGRSWRPVAITGLVLVLVGLLLAGLDALA